MVNPNAAPLALIPKVLHAIGPVHPVGRGDMPNASDALLRGIARDESLTRGLGDEEARMLVDWLVGWAEVLADGARTAEEAERLDGRLRRRGRAIARFVQLWLEPRSRGSAAQLAATERFSWPLPRGTTEPADLMETILNWERSHAIA